MAQNYYNLLQGKNLIDTSTENPFFEFKNESSVGTNDGTAIVAQMFQELYAFFINLAKRQNQTPSGVTDVAYSTDTTKQQFFLWMEEFIRPTGSIFFEYPSNLTLLQQYPQCEFVNINTINGSGVWRNEGNMGGYSFGSSQETPKVGEHFHYMFNGWYEPAGAGYNSLYELENTVVNSGYCVVVMDANRNPVPENNQYHMMADSRNFRPYSRKTGQGVAIPTYGVTGTPRFHSTRQETFDTYNNLLVEDVVMRNRDCRMYKKTGVNLTRR